MSDQEAHVSFFSLLATYVVGSVPLVFAEKQTAIGECSHDRASGGRRQEGNTVPAFHGGRLHDAQSKEERDRPKGAVAVGPLPTCNSKSR